MRKGTILIAVAVITTTLAVLAGLIWFALQADSVRKVLNLSPKNTATEETNTNTTVTNTVTNTAVNTNTVTDAAAGWLAFSDTNGAYTAKYPSTYVAERCNGGDEYFSVLPPGAASLCDGAYQGIFIEKRVEKTVASAVTAIKATATNPVESTAIVDGLTATRLAWTDQPAMGGEGLTWDVYVVLTSKGVFEIANSDKAQSTTYTTFLANVDFLASTADWKTYTNVTYGFSFKYPREWSVASDKLPTTIQESVSDQALTIGINTNGVLRPSLSLHVNPMGWGLKATNKTLSFVHTATGLQVTKTATTAQEQLGVFNYGEYYSVRANEEDTTLSNPDFSFDFVSSRKGESDAAFDQIVQNIISSFTFTK